MVLVDSDTHFLYLFSAATQIPIWSVWCLQSGLVITNNLPDIDAVTNVAFWP